MPQKGANFFRFPAVIRMKKFTSDVDCFLCIAPDEDGKTEERPESPVHDTLDTIPAELYVADQQTWIGLKKNSKILPFCCR